VKKISKKEEGSKREELGILYSSGLVAGDALTGVLIAFLIYFSKGYEVFYHAHEETFLAGSFGPWLALIAFSLIVLSLYRSTKLPKAKKE
jgi:hypothetical protein